MVTFHIAGLPVEEVLLAAIAAAGPLIALIGWEISSRVKRLRSALRRRTGQARLWDHECGRAEQGQGVDG
ncbi:hypothetical protein HPO96_32870 [Kribbella sandramycini]|uniref:Uncharacterized protein n=1 Tax=Kribbella sandramycini TaxID=60450 RepID=A0A7Y4L646_9ACTN|nr:hypothetical protein [Kribbella sandramycini]MBB6566051.1 hypothetical protein [Kribbella sandramycini]NOL45052.1 hypothetical protein [Kribbella sandramycini]